MNELDAAAQPSAGTAAVMEEVTNNTANKIVLLNSKGEVVGFRTASTMEEEVREHFGGLHI